MISILQLSDFHIKTSMSDPEDNQVITSMIRFLKKQKIETHILVYNGDVIDASAINEIVKDIDDIAEKAKMWDFYAEKAYKKAEKYFTYIMNELDISNHYVLICCGNHDVNNNLPTDKTMECPYPEIEGKEKKHFEYTTHRFDKWNDFCSRMKIKNYSVENSIFSIDGLNFCVVNTQWRDKYAWGYKTPLCLNCSSLTSLLNDKQKLLAENDKKRNIYVAHNPFGDVCEDKLHEWKENKYNALINDINTQFGVFLLGDKHSSSTLGSQFIVGAPLDEKEKDIQITYRIHQYFDSSVKHRALEYKNGTWKLSVDNSDDDITNIVALSSDSLKPQALQYLFKDTNVDLIPSEIISFDKFRSESQWMNLNDIFQIFVQTSHILSDNHSERINYKNPTNGIFDTLRDIMSKPGDDGTKVNTIVQGPYRSGKSIFMTVLYLNLMYSYCNGLFPEIPIYINLENFDNNETGKKSMQSVVLKKVEVAIDIAKKSKEKICLILDGIPQYIYSPSSEYEEVKSLVKDIEDSEYISKFIYCIDKNENLNYVTCSFYRDKAKYLVYFDSITTQNFTETKKYPNFINAFCVLEGLDDSKKAIMRRNYDALSFKNIDFCLLTLLKDTLLKDNLASEKNIELTRDLRQNIVARVKKNDLSLLAKAAFLIYYKNMNMDDVKKKVRGIRDDDIKVIIKYQILAQYLIALNYINIISNFRKITGRNKWKKVSEVDRSALNQLYDDEICRLIVDYLEADANEQLIIDFEKKYYSDLEFAGQSTLTYIIGKVVGSTELLSILKREDVDIEKRYKEKIRSEIPMDSRELYEYYVAKRSIEIGKTRNDSSYHDGNYYILSLLSDDNSRKINRNFYLEFYGDRLRSEFKFDEEIILRGLDFYHTYHTLATRLENWYESRNENSLSRIELFTLCDLIQTRLDYPYITYRRVRNKLEKVYQKEIGTTSLFYNFKYCAEKNQVSIKVLDFAIKMIDFYKSVHKSEIYEDMFVQYLEYEREIFETVSIALQRASSQSDIDINLEYKHLFSTMSKLKDAKKIGWYFEDTPKSLTQKEIDDAVQDKPVYESVLEHVYESYLIGLLYLPNTDMQDANYNKQDVLNMLLIHDLGEAVVGDYPPAFSDYKGVLAKERVVCRNYYFAGVHPEYATLTEYQHLWNDWANGNKGNVNVSIAKEIDKIQMLYKLLSLLKDGVATFSSSRFNDFFESVDIIKTDKGKHIYNSLIASNAEFVDIAKKHNYTIVKL